MTRQLTPRQIEVLAAYGRIGDQQAAATSLGISVQTVKNFCSQAYERLGVASALEAFRALGWLRLPGDHELVALSAGEEAAAGVRSLEALHAGLGELLDHMRAPGSDAETSRVGDPAGTPLSVAGDGVAATPAPSLRRVI